MRKRRFGRLVAAGAVLLVLIAFFAAMIRTTERRGGDHAGVSNSLADMSRDGTAGPREDGVGTSTTNVALRVVPDELAFNQFNAWADRFAAADAAQRSAMESEGVALAQARRAALKHLIQTDPELALRESASYGVRTSVPSAVASLLEDRVSGRGELAVMGALAEPGRERDVVPVFRTAEIAGQHYAAFVYGRRLGEPTRRNIPLNGIAIDGQFAVNADPVRVLDADEAAEALTRLASAKDPRCGVSGDAVTIRNEPTPVEVAGTIRYLCGANHIKPYNDQWVAAEGDGPTGGESGSEIAASAWTEGTKRVLVIRVDFPDMNLALTDVSAATMVTNLNAFYLEMSYGRTGFAPVGSGSAVTPVLRMTNSAAWYGTNDYYNPLRSEARAAATAAGYTLGNYELDVICMGAVPGFGWAGLAYIGAPGAWLRNSFGTGVAGHELGHNYGLNHANYWDTGGQSVLGAGTSIEYGDAFDTMGSANAGAYHFNARYKAYLNWLRTNEVQRVTTSGTYRIYTHDSATSPGVRGLYVARNSQTNYWIEFRQKFTSNKWLMSGAGLRTALSGNQKSHLLDFTPGSTDGKNDSAIVIGRTYSDFGAGVHITPIGKGGTTPESLDVVVNVGSFPGNVAPTLGIAASATNAATGVAIDFTATPADGNGDTLAYYWDFGDGNFGTNGAGASKSWSSAGEYVVQCTVTDMKGGTASDSIIVRIGSPTTYRISGSVTDGAGPLAGVRVSVSSTRMTYTDSDGTYNLVNLAAGSYTVSASLYPHTLNATGFSNPVVVGPDRASINFSSSTIIAPSITSQPASQSASPGANVTFTVSATGTAPLTYQWRFNAVNISGATSSSYTRTNVQSGDAGNYSVVVANAAGSMTSSNATLTLNTPPNITGQPQSQSVIAGTNVSFTVQASGSTPLAYQWRLNGTNLPGATAATYSVGNAQPGHAGSYLVVITNTLGAATSSVATLTVNFSLMASATSGGSVSKNPSASTYASGTVVTLTASSTSIYTFTGWSGDASGSNNPLAVTMTTNKTIVANFASPVPDLIVDNPAASYTGTWSTIAGGANLYGPDYRLASGTTAGSPSSTATFRPTVVTEGRYDVYLWSPTVTRAASSVPVSIVSADGTTNLTTDQTTGAGTWELIGTALNFASGTNGYVRLGNNVGQGGRDVAADAVKWVYSSTQDTTAPSITSQPASVTFNQGSSFQFNVTATGTAPRAYQWRFNNGDIANATNTSLVISNAGAGQAGNYLVVVTNAGGAVTSQAAVATLNTSPSVAITTPANGAVLTAPASFTVAATASDSGGSVTQVQFYNGGSLLGTDTTSPYSANVSSLAAGNYTLTAVATDNLGLRSTNSVAIVVNSAPTVALTAPTNGAVFPALSDLTLTATANDADGTLTKVEFFQGTTKLGEDLTGPYSFDWSGVTAGIYALTARATDNQGAVSTSAVVNIIVGNNQAPTVVVTSPTNGTVLSAPASFSVVAVASDVDGSVAQVEFYNGSTLLGTDTTSPYSASVTGAGSGTYTLSAVATDTFGSKATNSVVVTVRKGGKKGTYAALYYETAAVVQESSGSLNITTTDEGTFSGFVLSLGKKTSFKGRLDTNSSASIHLLRKNASALDVALAVVESNGVDQVTGTVTDGNWQADLWGARAAFHAATNPAPAEGIYTFLLPGCGDASGPQGYGYGAVKVTAAGRVVLRGVLADGQRAARITTLSADGQWPMYVSLYRGAGLALGWINLADRVDDDFSGTVAHLRPAGSLSPFYGGGFTNETTLLGSRFVRPTESGAPVLTLLDAELTCEGGNWQGRATNRVSLITGNKIRDDADMRVKGSVSAKSGFFSGATTDDAGRPARWRGVVLQKAGYGAGQALGTNGTARILLTP